jgi:hypothetical protein
LHKFCGVAICKGLLKQAAKSYYLGASAKPFLIQQRIVVLTPGFIALVKPRVVASWLFIERGGTQPHERTIQFPYFAR